MKMLMKPQLIEIVNQVKRCLEVKPRTLPEIDVDLMKTLDWVEPEFVTGYSIIAVGIMLFNQAATEVEQTEADKKKRGAIWQILNPDNYHDPALDPIKDQQAGDRFNGWSGVVKKHDGSVAVYMHPSGFLDPKILFFHEGAPLIMGWDFNGNHFESDYSDGAGEGSSWFDPV